MITSRTMMLIGLDILIYPLYFYSFPIPKTAHRAQIILTLPVPPRMAETKFLCVLNAKHPFRRRKEIVEPDYRAPSAWQNYLDYSDQRKVERSWKLTTEHLHYRLSTLSKVKRNRGNWHSFSEKRNIAENILT